MGPARLPSGLGRKKKLFALREGGEKGSVVLQASSCQSSGAENKTLFSLGPRALCQAAPLIGSFPAPLAPGGVAVRTAQGSLRRSPEWVPPGGPPEPAPEEKEHGPCIQRALQSPPSSLLLQPTGSPDFGDGAC